MKFDITSFVDEEKTEFIAIPNAEKTIENPRTKNIVFSMTFVFPVSYTHLTLPTNREV